MAVPLLLPITFGLGFLGASAKRRAINQQVAQGQAFLERSSVLQMQSIAGNMDEARRQEQVALEDIQEQQNIQLGRLSVLAGASGIATQSGSVQKLGVDIERRSERAAENVSAQTEAQIGQLQTQFEGVQLGTEQKRRELESKKMSKTDVFLDSILQGISFFNQGTQAISSFEENIGKLEIGNFNLGKALTG